MPDVGDTAWSTALALTGWASRQWSHDGNNAAEAETAVGLLDRAAAGEQFRCVEFSILLAQSLNAVDIPAGMVHALRADYDRPVTGMGHVVVEAWIEDFDGWVVLDGQNATYWSVDDTPLSAVALWRRFRSGDSPADFVTVTGTSAPDAELWWRHWADVGVGDSALVDDRGYAAIFQGQWILGRKRLIRDSELCYPRLSNIRVSVTAGDHSTSLLTMATDHPYATGVFVDDGELAVDRCSLLTTPGERSFDLRVGTRWGNSAARTVKYRVVPQQ